MFCIFHLGPELLVRRLLVLRTELSSRFKNFQKNEIKSEKKTKISSELQANYWMPINLDVKNDCRMCCRVYSVIVGYVLGTKSEVWFGNDRDTEIRYPCLDLKSYGFVQYLKILKAFLHEDFLLIYWEIFTYLPYLLYICNIKTNRKSFGHSLILLLL